MHGHDLSFGAVTGTGWLHLLLLVAALAVVAAALLLPFLGPPDRVGALAVSGGAAGVVVLVLLLSAGIDAPRQAAVAALALAAWPVLAVHRPDGPLARPAAVAAPWVVCLAAVVTVTELVRAALASDPGAVARLVDTALLVGAVGVAWLLLCRPRSRPVARGAHVAGWVLGNALLAGVAAVAVAALPT